MKTDLGFIPLFNKNYSPSNLQIISQRFSKDETKSQILTFRFKTRLYPVDPQFSHKLQKNIDNYIYFLIAKDQNLHKQTMLFSLDKPFRQPYLYFNLPTGKKSDRTSSKANEKVKVKFNTIPITYWNNFCFDLYKLHDIKIIIYQDFRRVYLSIDHGDTVFEKRKSSIQIRPSNFIGYTKTKSYIQFKTELTAISITKGIDYDPVAVNVKYPRFSSGHYRKKIKKYNNIDAMYWLGMNYYEGSHGEIKDYYQALKWFRKASKKKHVLAMYQLGLCYMNGTGIKQNDKTAYGYFKRAANYFYSDAVAMCMYYLISGRKKRDILKPGKKIYKIFKNALGQGNANTLFYYDYYFAQHPDFFRLNLREKNRISNIGEFMAQSAARNHPKAYYYLATKTEGNKRRIAMGHFQSNFLNCLKAAELNFSPAYVKIGDYYLSGRKDYKQIKLPTHYFKFPPPQSSAKLKKSPQQAFFWYKKASDAGNNTGHYKLACCYLLGRGIKQDKKQARQLLLKAVKAELPRAIIVLNLLNRPHEAGKLFFSHNETQSFKIFQQGKSSDDIFYTAMCLKYGIGADKNEPHAFKLLKQLNNAYAKSELGKCYETGSGVSTDKIKAIYFYKQAAESKIFGVAFRLAQLYNKNYDKKTAIKWYRIAANNDNGVSP
ncbi:MAG: sel1 repeat family protein [Victivallaceae bacterium]|nr:sel1 repeat family protein [Victivallaceae bacterium]